MKKVLLSILLTIFSFGAFAQWEAAGDKIKTKWAEKIDINNVLPEYPRPIMERGEWKNLNGLWDYSILPVGQREPTQFDGKILVPFAVESSLSGVQKSVGPENELWYKRTFTIPSGWKGKKILLHFGAVDWKAEIYVNDIKIGIHTGGYVPFSFDITPFLVSGEQKIVVKVWDGTDTGFQPRGKQVIEPRTIWYTPVTGIWQTVWLEPVNEKHITYVKSVPNIDTSNLSVNVDTHNPELSDLIEVKVKDGSTVVATSKAAIGQTIDLNIPDAKLWTPEMPFLYDMEIILYSKGKVVDRIKSYCAMRKISTKKMKTVLFECNSIIRIIFI